MCPGAKWCQGNANKTVRRLSLARDRAPRVQNHFPHHLDFLPNKKNGNIPASSIVFIWPFVCQRSLADPREQASCVWIWVPVPVRLPPPFNPPVRLGEALTPGALQPLTLLARPQKSQFHPGEQHCNS